MSQLSARDAGAPLEQNPNLNLGGAKHVSDSGPASSQPAPCPPSLSVAECSARRAGPTRPGASGAVAT